METSASASEITPLLADPPIDDDIYHYEQRIFPSPLQKQLLLSKFTLSFLVSRLFEISSAIAIMRVFNTTIIPATIYTMLVTLSSGSMWSLASTLLEKKSRKATISYAIVGERLTAILFCTILLQDVSSHYWSMLAISMVLVLIQRSCDSIQVQVIEEDWAHVLANNESVPYAALVKLFQAIKTCCWTATPILGTFLAQSLGVPQMIKVLRILAFFSMVVEYTLVRKLYSTCYALRVPNLVNESDNKVAFARPSLERIMFYIRKRPRPVLISVGVILVHTTLLTIRSQQLYYMDQHSVPLVFIGMMAAATIIKIPFPYAVAVVLNLTVSAIAIWALYTSHATTFGITCLLSRLSLHSIDNTARGYVHRLIADPQSFVLFSLIESRLAHVWSLVIFFLPALWVTADRFIWPVTISVVLSLLGLIAVETGFRWGEAPPFDSNRA